MNEEPSSQVDPFSPAVLDEATELRALTRALELAKGFKLIFARCNQADQRRSLVQQVRSELPSLNIQEIQFTAPITHLLDALRGKIQLPVPDVLFLSGLEYSLPSASEAHLTPLIANLNASRNSFPEVISCPLVLWVPEFVLNAIMLGAPDFFSIRSGVYYFAAGPGETVDLANNLTVGGEWTLLNLTPGEKEERIGAIKALLADYEALPAGRRDENTEIRLRVRLANLLITQGSYDSARQYYQQVLEQAQKLGNRIGEAAAYGGLGLTHLYNKEYSQAESCLRRDLEISRETNDRFNEAMSLRNLGNVYRYIGNVEEARKAYQQSLEILHEVGDRVEEGISVYNLAHIFLEQGQFSEAEKHLARSVEIAREGGDKDTEANALLTLGVAFSREGRMLEAEKAYTSSLEIFEKLNDPSQEPAPLHNLSLLHERQGNLQHAVDFQRRLVKILRGMNDQRLDSARQRLSELERKAKEQQENQTQPV